MLPQLCLKLLVAILLRLQHPVSRKNDMYKGTRHSGKTWGYKASSASTSSSFSTVTECRDIVAKCKKTFTELGLLRVADFDELGSRMAIDPTKVVGARIGRAKEHLASIGVPQRLIFATPNYLLVAPKLGALLSGMRRTYSGRLPVELRELRDHLESNSALEERVAALPVPKVLFHVAKDGTRTAFTPTSSFQAERLKRQASGKRLSSEQRQAREHPPRPAVSVATASPKPVASPAPVETVFRCELKPTAAQKALLDTLFSGPILLRTLIQRADRKPRSRHDASMFLLQNRKELEPYLAKGNRADAVDFLTNLIVRWASRIPERIEVRFPAYCSLSDSNQVFLPIPRLGGLTSHNEIRLIEARHRSMYKPAFVLAHETHGYTITIVFLRRDIHAPARGPAHAQAPENRPRREPPHKQPGGAPLESDRFLSLFRALDHLRADEARIAKQFVKPDFDTLEGRAVHGGLPTLGKRRK